MVAGWRFAFDVGRSTLGARRSTLSARWSLTSNVVREAPPREPRSGAMDMAPRREPGESGACNKPWGSLVPPLHSRHSSFSIHHFASLAASKRNQECRIENEEFRTGNKKDGEVSPAVHETCFEAAELEDDLHRVRAGAASGLADLVGVASTTLVADVVGVGAA